MNRTYKVIWSKARRCYVVVSELAKGQHKSSSKSEHISSNVHRGGDLGKAALAAVVASLLTFSGLVYSPVMAADPVKDANGNTITNTDSKVTDINANITGKGNTITDSSNVEIVGDTNTVTNEVKKEDGSVAQVRSDDARIVGSGNTISGSRNQQVIGDNNQIIGRDLGTVTDYTHPEGREKNVSDLTIGRGNVIQSTNTYRNEWDSLKVIGNNNEADLPLGSAGGPSAGIVIGDNQNIDNIEDSIVIGSLSPDEQKEKVGEDGYKSDKYFIGSNSIVVGYHATSSKDASTVIGNRSKVSGNFQTVTGLRSTIEGNYYNELNYLDGQSGNFASIYGSFNKIEDATGADDMDGVGNSINGSMNVTSNARGTMIMGVGNTVTHSKGEFILPKDDAEDDSEKNTGDWLEVGMWTAGDYALGKDITGKNLTYPADQTYAIMRDAWQHYMETSGGAVSVLGNSNTSDYAIRSQILGTNNILKGAEDDISSYNTISGFSNTGTNVKRTAIVGTGNNLTNGVDNVVIGDYHTLENGQHNVILGSMASEEKAVKKTAKAAWAATDDNPDGTYTYTVNEQVALKPNTKDIENAVMVGYNTDATVDGGVALGSDSIASTEAGIEGYDAQGKKHAKSDKDYATWVSTDAAVSVGGADREVKYKDKEGKDQTQTVKSTRQITNLAAGTQDTDAVNVAQLKASEANINTTINNVDKKVAVIFDDKGSLMSTDATIAHQILEDLGSFPEGEGQSIALGKGANAFMQGGRKAKAMLFGMKKAAGAIAIGEGAQALSQSIDIGNRTYTGDIGDVTISKYWNWGSGSGVGSVLLGTNSYTGGTLSTLIGDYSIMSTAYPYAYDSHYGSYTQNAGAVSIGALNSIESATSDNSDSGIANSIVGLANKTNNANGALIYGAGNTITNSFADVATPGSAGSAAKAAQSFRDSVQKNPGGAALAIGGGNAIDRSIRSQVIGVNNKLTGNTYHKDWYFDDSWNYHPAVDGVSSQYNMIDGYNNTAQNVNHAYVIGANNIIQGKKFSDTTKNGVLNDADWEKSQQDDNLIVIGDNHTLANDVANDIILGTADADKKITTSVSNIVMIGHNADAQKEGGVALGAGSVASVDNASTDANAIGYDPATKKASTDTSSTWKSTAAAVSIGDASQNITRQITNLAAGAQDTDAVNVAQLKAAQTHFYSVNSTDETADNYNNDGAKGKNSLAAGVGVLAKGDNSVAIGTNAKAQNDALAVGESANAGNNGIAIGMHANAGYGQNMALGYYASVANGVSNSTALGYGSQVTKRDILKSDGSDGVISVGKSVGQSGEAGMTRRIINVKAGVNDTDAVNVSQLKQQAQAATTEVVPGTNIASVTKYDNTADGHTIYKVNAKGTTVSGDGNFNITSKTNDATNVTDYAISLNNTITIGSGAGTHPITIDGTKGEVSGLTNTTWDKNANYSTSTKAATEAQLQKAMNDAQKAAEANDTDTHVNAGTYAVTTVKDAAGKDTQGVALDVVDKTGTSVGKVTITDVAKASDVGDVSKLSKEVQNAEGSTTVVDAINNVNTKVDKVDEKVGDLQYGTEGQTNVVTNGDSVTKAIGDLDKAIGEAATEAGKHTIVSTTDSNLSVKNVAKEGEAANYQISLNKDLNVDSVTAKKIATKDLEATGAATIGKVTINADDKGTIGGLTNKTWDAKNITSGQAATEDQLQAATKNAINYDGDDSKTITLREDTTIKNVADTTIEEGSKNAVNAGTVYKATKNAINYDGDDSKTITLREDTTINNVADTTIEQGSKNAVNAGTVYNETRVAKDGNFVKQANTAGENLSALDNQVTANTESIYHINNRVSDLDNRVNKVGAGAAALAALHPLDFDPDDKWDFAVGYGNYRNANSVAFGAFYRPNEDTMFSLGTNFGNGENMFNAGLSFKIGQGGSGITTSKTAMAKTISSLKDTVHKQDQKIEGLENVVDTQDKKIAELEALVKEQGEMIRQYVGKK